MAAESGLDKEGILFLIADFLSRETPCQEAAELLRRELDKKQLLGTTYDWKGGARPSTYEDVKRRHGKLSSLQLQKLLEAAIAIPEAEGKPGEVPSSGDEKKGEQATTVSLVSLFKPICVRNVAKARVCREQLAQAYRELSEVVRQLKVLYAAIQRAEDSDGDQPNGQAGAMGAKEGVSGGGAVAMEVEQSPGTDRESPMVLSLDHDEEDKLREDTEEMGEASRGRMRKELEDRKASLMASVEELVKWLRDDGDLRSREAVLAGRWLPDRLQRRQVGVPVWADGQALRDVVYHDRIKHLKTISGHRCHPVYCLKWDMRGEYVITGADDSMLKVWCFRSGRLMMTLRGSSSVIIDMSISSDNRLLAAASEDRFIRVYRLKDGACVAVLRGHTESVNYVYFHPLINVLISVSDDGTARCWDLTRLTADDSALLLDGLAFVVDGLVLEHVRISRGSALLNAPPQKVRVKSVSICPLGGYFVTGGEDSVARVWSMAGLEAQHLHGGKGQDTDAMDVEGSGDDEEEEEQEEEKDEKEQQDEKKDDDDDDEDEGPVRRRRRPVLPQEGPGGLMPELVRVLRGHESSVSDVLYSHLGDRLVTASVLDGTVRIWSWGPGYSNLLHIVLQCHAKDKIDLTRQEQEEHADNSRRPKRKKDSKPKPQVDSAMWMADDGHVITMQHITPADNAPEDFDIEQRIKVWNSRTGQLVHELRGHDQIVNVLSVHPSDPRVAVTADNNGRVCIWDVVAGRLLTSFTNLLLDGPEYPPHFVHGQPVSVHDGGFNRDWCLALSDSCGRLALYGVENANRYWSVPGEQYFETDYDDLVWDVNGYALDRNHQVPPHILPRSMLVNALSAAYDPDEHKYDLTTPRPLSHADMHEKRAAAQQLATEVDKLLETRRTTAAAAKDDGSDRGWGAKVVTLGDAKRRRPAAVTLTQETDYYDDFDSGSFSFGSDDDDDDSEEYRPARRGSRRRRLQGGRMVGTNGEELQGRQMWDALREERREALNRDRQDRYLRRQRQKERRRGYASSEESDASFVYEGPRRTSARNRAHYAESSDNDDSDGSDEDEDEDEEYRASRRAGKRSRRHHSRAQRSSRRTRQHEQHSRGHEPGPRSSSSQQQGQPVEVDDWDTAITIEPALPPAPSLADDAPAERVPALSDMSPGNLAASMMPTLMVSPTRLLQQQQHQQAGGDRQHLKCEFCGKGNLVDLPLPPPELGPHPLVMHDKKNPNRHRTVWVHYPCARWSPQVFTNAEGEWCNIAVEIRRGRGIRCQSCRRVGATIGCAIGSCQASLHYACAVASGWTFAEGTVYHCLKHRPSQGGRAGGGGARAHGRAGEEGDEGEYEEGEMHDGKPGATKSSYKIQEGTELYKQWLRDVRQEQDLGRLAPQVGDRVVYLPHAHSCFIRLVQKWQQPKPDEKESDASGGADGGAGAAAAPGEGQAEQPKAAAEGTGQGAEEATDAEESGSKPTAAEEEGGAPPAEAGANAAATSSTTEQDKEQEGEDTSVHGPWEFFPRAWSAVLCVVAKVEYGLPESETVLQACDSITATVTLHVVGVPDDDNTRHNKRKEAAAEGPDSPALVVGGSRIPRRFREVTEREEGLWMGFTATIRECEAADFLVLEGTYLTSLRQDWSVGRRVKSPYFDTQSKQDRFVHGTIKAVEPWEPEVWPNSALRLLQVDWDPNSPSERPLHMSPWEVVPDDWERSELPLWPTPAMSPEETTVAAELVKRLMDDTRLSPFFVPVAPEEYPSYETTVPLPMDLSLISARVQAGYYRQPDGMDSDLRLIWRNCRIFNDPESEICRLAKKVQRSASDLRKKVAKVREQQQLQQETLAAVPEETQQPAAPQPEHAEMEGAGEGQGKKRKRSAQLEREAEEEYEPEEEEEEEHGDHDFYYYGEDGSDDEVWGGEEPAGRRRSSRQRKARVLSPELDHRHEAARERARPQRSAKTTASQGMKRTAALLRRSEMAPFDDDDEDYYDDDEPDLGRTPTRRSTRQASRRGEASSEFDRSLRSRHPPGTPPPTAGAARPARPGASKALAMEEAEEEEEEANFVTDEAAMEVEQAQQLQQPEEQDERGSQSHEHKEPQHYKVATGGEGPAGEPEQDTQATTGPPQAKRAATGAHRSRRGAHEDRDDEQEQQHHGPSAAHTGRPQRSRTRPPAPSRADDQHDDEEEQQHGPRRSSRAHVARAAVGVDDDDADLMYEEPPVTCRMAVLEEVVQELTREDKFGVMRAEGGRDVRRTATLDSIQTKISEQRYVTVAEAEAELRAVLQSLPRRFPMESVYETESKRLLDRLHGIVARAVRKAAASSSSSGGGGGGGTPGAGRKKQKRAT